MLDFDTAATGLTIFSMPLMTPFGTITASTSGSLNQFFVVSLPNQGLSGNSLFHDSGGDGFAQLAFGFSASSITFRWGGYYSGAFTAQALDASLNVVDSFFDSDTSLDLPGGPTTLSGAGIRYLRFGDYPGGANNAAIDDVAIEAVPEPATLFLLGGGLLGLAARRRRTS